MEGTTGSDSGTESGVNVIRDKINLIVEFPQLQCSTWTPESLYDYEELCNKHIDASMTQSATGSPVCRSLRRSVFDLLDRLVISSILNAFDDTTVLTDISQERRATQTFQCSNKDI